MEERLKTRLAAPPKSDRLDENMSSRFTASSRFSCTQGKRGGKGGEEGREGETGGGLCGG
jgi:hypothetical protein